MRAPADGGCMDTKQGTWGGPNCEHQCRDPSCLWLAGGRNSSVLVGSPGLRKQPLAFRRAPVHGNFQ